MTIQIRLSAAEENPQSDHEGVINECGPEIPSGIPINRSECCRGQMSGVSVIPRSCQMFHTTIPDCVVTRVQETVGPAGFYELSHPGKLDEKIVILFYILSTDSPRYGTSYAVVSAPSWRPV